MKIMLKQIEIDQNKALQSRGLEPGGKVQKFIDSEVLKRCAPYVPRDNGDLNESGRENTDIGSGEVSYDTPYARRWHYEPAKFQGAPRRGNYWFERMLNEGGRYAILKGVTRLSGARPR